MDVSRRYRIHETIGRGAFGTVYRATLEGRGGFAKTVAVKVLNQTQHWDETAARLRDEARLLGMVRHNVLLQVDGLVQLDGRWAVITEFLDGCSLRDILRATPVPMGVMLEIIGEVAGGLHIAYSGATPDGQPLRLVHRDVKPSNIQVTKVGEVKLLDFGVARGEFAGRESETFVGVIGTPGYMSPERLDGTHGAPGDVYALGVVLAEGLLGGRLGKTSAVPAKHARYLEERMDQLDEALGAKLSVVEPLLLSMLAYDPDDRPTAKEVERLCRELRYKAGNGYLREWAEDNVHGVLEGLPTLQDNEDSLCGMTLIEGQDAKQLPETEVLTGRVLFEDPTASARPAASPVVPVLMGALAGIAVLATVGLVGAGSFWLGSQQRAAEPAEPPTAQAEPSPEPALTPEPAPDEPVDSDTPDDAADGQVSAQGTAAEPVPDAQPPATAAEEPSAQPGPGTLITQGLYATWLGQHPQWHKREAAVTGHVNGQYLDGWTGLVPPDAGAPMTNLPYDAAAAFCVGRGGLAAMDAAPSTWSTDSAPFSEWRAGGARQFDGANKGDIDRKGNGFTGARCAR